MPKTPTTGLLHELDDFDVYHRRVQRTDTEIEKNQFLVGLAGGRSVLDIGCIDHSAETALGLGERWLHRQLREASASLVGLDILTEDAARLGEHGYDIRIGDAERFDLGQRFDLIVAGDLIEHLSNPGMFLQSAKQHLNDSGRLVITTPNPFNLEQAALIGRRGQIIVNPEHVLWLDPVTAHRLVRRAGFSVVAFHWLKTRFELPMSERPRLRDALIASADFLSRRRAMWRRDFGLVLQASPDNVRD